jgi:hypothetical protein
MKSVFGRLCGLQTALPRRHFAASLFLLLLLVGATFCSELHAQVQNDGTVIGRVTDGKGGVIVDATVTLTAQDTGRTVTVTTKSTGDYVFNSVPLGIYVLHISAPDFAEYAVEQIVVHAAEDVTINAELKPASVNATVTVMVAQSVVIDTGSATVGAMIDNTLVENLPVDGNNEVAMAALLPGVTDINAPTTFTRNTGGPGYNISGSRNNQNLMLLDGSIWNNLYNNTGLSFPPSQAVQEVSVQINNYKAEYGRTVGSIFNVLSKAGSDTVHGTLWEFFQNSAMNASDYISKENPPLNMNQFGGSIGGPIQRGKMFYFLSFEDLMMQSTVVAQAQTLTLPERGLAADGVSSFPCQTAAYGSGPCANFADDGSTTWANPVLSSSAAQNIQTLNAAYAQATGGSPTATSPCVALLATQPTTLANPEIPAVCWNPVSVALAKLVPLPNVTVASALPYAVSSASQPQNHRSVLLRGDWNKGAHTTNARYYQTWANDQTANGVSQGQGIANYDINLNDAYLHFGNISDTWVVTPNLLNVARAGYKRYTYFISPSTPNTLSSFGANYTQPDDTLPMVVVDGRLGYKMGSAINRGQTVDEGLQLDDMLSWAVGKHNVQAGVEFLRLQYLDRHASAPQLHFNNDKAGTDPAMLYTLGVLHQSSFANATNMAAVQHDLYFYVQDDWRVLPRLTLNLGLRWEIPFSWYQPDGQAATFIPGYQSAVFTNAPANLAYVGDRGIRNSLVGTPYKDFAPRFGFSYDLFGNGKTAIRGGFGIFYDAINAQTVGVAAPYTYTETQAYNVGGVSNPLLGLPAIPPDYVPGQPVSFPAPYSITFPDKNFRTPYTQAVNIGIQHRLSKSSMLEANYVGRFSRHLALGYDENPAIYDCTGAYFQINPAVYCTGADTTDASYQARVKYPGFDYGGAGVLDYMTVGFANYNSLQLIYTHSKGSWLTMTASYTFSKSIDDSSNTGIVNTTDQPSLAIHRSVSDFNATQILNLGYVLHYSPIRRHFNAPVRAVLNGWGLTGMYSARSGHPFSVNSAADDSLRFEKPEYVSIVPGGYAPLNAHRHRLDKVAEWFNTASFVDPAKGTYGNAPRNFLTGPGYISNHVGVMRTFKMPASVGKTVVLHAEAYNVFNTPNLGQPGNSLSGKVSKNTQFGEILSTVGDNGAVGTNGRRLQLDIALHF